MAGTNAIGDNITGSKSWGERMIGTNSLGEKISGTNTNGERMIGPNISGDNLCKTFIFICYLLFDLKNTLLAQVWSVIIKITNWSGFPKKEN